MPPRQRRKVDFDTEGGLIKEPAKSRFWRKVSVDSASGCWLWTSATLPSGYGRFSFNKKTRLAHRLSWEMHNGPVPKGKMILHTCDTRECVNPDHLYAGSHKQNMADMSKRGRLQSGQKHWKAVLTPEIVRRVRQSNKTTKELADQYGVTAPAIHYIRIGRTWKGVV